MLKWSLAEYTEIIVVKLIGLAQVHINGYCIIFMQLKMVCMADGIAFNGLVFMFHFVLLHVWPVA